MQCFVEIRIDNVVNELLGPLGLFAKVLHVFPVAINETVTISVVRFKISQFVQLFVRYFATVLAVFIKDFPIASEQPGWIEAG